MPDREPRLAGSVIRVAPVGLVRHLGLDLTRQPAYILSSGFPAIMLIGFQDYQLFI